MITLENRFFPLRSAACFVIEGGIIIVSVLLSYIFLHESGGTGEATVRDAMIRGIVVAIFCQSCMYLLDLYDFRQSHTSANIFFSMVFSVGIVLIGLGLLSYIQPRFAVDGNMYYLTIFFVIVFLLLWRVAFDYYLEHMAPRENLLIVGTGEVARMVAEEIRRRHRLGFHLKGFIGRDSAEISPTLSEACSVIGDYGNLPKIARDCRVRKIVVAINERRGGSPVRELLDLKVSGIGILEWQGFFEKLAGRIPIDNLPPSFFIFTPGFRKSKVTMACRQFVSMIVSACLILLLFPVILIVSALVKLESPGPVIYSQDRVGQNGKVFRIYKFRSMRQDAEKDGAPRWASKDDPRVTRVGKILRSLRLDEIPQLFNVFRGDINLVGPRPERPEFVVELQKVIPYYALRHTVKPGLTGWAQVMFPYSSSIQESKEKLQYDLFYIKNMSLKLDMLILFHTLKIVLLGRGAR